MKPLFFYLSISLFSCFNLYAQNLVKEGSYLFKSSKKSDLQNGTIIEVRKDNIIYLTTYFAFSCRIVYKGDWKVQEGYLYICNLKDTNGIEPSLRSVEFDTIDIKANKKILFCISDEAKFTTLFPAKITIDDTNDYFLKNGDTLAISNNYISKIGITVEDYSEIIKVSITNPVLIRLTVKNRNPGTINYYFRDLKLRMNKGKLYYNNISLMKLK